MTQSITINSPVDVTAMGFGKNLSAYPRRMEYGGTTYNFIDAGLRTVIRKGERIAQILTMSDGTSNYCLRSDNHGGSWTLLSIIQ
jgi:hypothetical protein